MIRRRGTSYLVGAGTVLLILLSLTFMIGFAVVMFLALSSPDQNWLPPGVDRDAPPPAFAFLFLGNLVAVLIGLALLTVYLIDVFHNPDLADNQDRRIMWALLVAFLGAWAMAVYWWMHLRPGGAAFRARAAIDATPSAAAGIARVIGLWVVTAPVALLMGVALLRDPGRLGELSSVSDAPLIFFVVVGLVVSTLMAAAWGLSTFRFRSAVLFIQLVVVWVGGMLFASGVRTHVSGWDVAEDAVLLLGALLQLVPGRR